PSRIVVTDSFADKDGNVVPATYYGMSSSFPLEMLVSVDFEDVNGKTKMTLRHSQTEGLSDKERTDMQRGWIESFDKLEEYLTKSRVAVGIAK
ncbi:MAG: SRPBCC domain-containing protein, partial [Crenarchaeota archaeon]|nr:SRPBCC domain-containing protein [Thermoproteota archaeon]